MDSVAEGERARAGGPFVGRHRRIVAALFDERARRLHDRHMARPGGFLAAPPIRQDRTDRSAAGLRRRDRRILALSTEIGGAAASALTAVDSPAHSFVTRMRRRTPDRQKNRDGAALRRCAFWDGEGQTVRTRNTSPRLSGGAGCATLRPGGAVSFLSPDRSPPGVSRGVVVSANL